MQPQIQQQAVPGDTAVPPTRDEINVLAADAVVPHEAQYRRYPLLALRHSRMGEAMLLHPEATAAPSEQPAPGTRQWRPAKHTWVSSGRVSVLRSTGR